MRRRQAPDARDITLAARAGDRTCRALLTETGRYLGIAVMNVLSMLNVELVVFTGGLTEREIDVLKLIAEGMSNPEIAEKLVLSVGTVKTHVKHIYGKLNVDDRVKAASKARELKLLG